MKIAVWNLERLKHRQHLNLILTACNKIRADILVLTETAGQARPDFKYCFETPKLFELGCDFYSPSENRVSIFTNYKLVRQYPTFDKYTALCVELATERGNLLVYGTIIGVFGNRNPNFADCLAAQIEDIKRLSEMGNICVAGDYNLSFCDNYYYTKQGRAALLQCFSESKIALPTKDLPECIDHIAVSENFLRGAAVKTGEWNCDKALSDHKGTVLQITADLISCRNK